MCDSLVGSITPATRQNGGRLAIALLEPGGVNDPPVIASTVVIRVSGSRCSARLAHVTGGLVCACVAAMKMIGRPATIEAMMRAGDLMCRPPTTNRLLEPVTFTATAAHTRAAGAVPRR